MCLVTLLSCLALPTVFDSVKAFSRIIFLYFQLRPLSTVGLLVFPKGQEDRDHPPLWLVDGTGAYPVRAICVGGGLDAKTGKPVAQIIQSRMQRKTDFAEMSLEECAKSLLNLLLSEDDAQDETSEPLLKRGTRLEIAGVGDGKRFIRIPFARLQPALEQ